ncbi:MAG: hypothetical protein KN64_13340 [Sulfurovum sp. AS07-7]|nr:MAG: hypothetical protein KN64_13340 [Sulfurovum sp. AS07-7]
MDEEAYESSDIKVMIFGQETYGWCGGFGKSICYCMKAYEEYFTKEGYKKNQHSFFRGIDFFKDELNNACPDKKIYYIWNNISKVGRYEAKGVTQEIRDLERTTFPVIQEEMEILKPDIVIFLSGNREDDILFSFPNATFSPLGVKLPSKKGSKQFEPVYQVTSSLLPEKSIRLYHPSYFGGFNMLKHNAIRALCP